MCIEIFRVALATMNSTDLIKVFLRHNKMQDFHGNCSVDVFFSANVCETYKPRAKNNRCSLRYAWVFWTEFLLINMT